MIGSGARWGKRVSWSVKKRSSAGSSASLARRGVRGERGDEGRLEDGAAEGNEGGGVREKE
jgi:hypothetical protein